MVCAVGKDDDGAAGATQQLQAVFDGAQGGLALIELGPGSQQGRLIAVNPALCAMTGYDASELLTRGAQDLLHPEEDVDHAAAFGRLRAGRGHEVVRRWRSGAGVPLRVRISATPVLVPSGPAARAVLTVQDVTAEHAAKAELGVSEQRFQAAFENAPIAMMLISLLPARAGEVLRANDAACRLFGYALGELVGSDVVDLTAHPDVVDKRALIARLASGGAQSALMEKRYLRADGDVIWGVLSATVVLGLDGRPDYYISQIQDVTDRKRAEQDLTRQALHDDLTGLPNRALLRDHLSQAVARAERAGRYVAALFLDLDDFKAVNDSLGHSGGDELLVAVAERLRGCLRLTDTAARLGGDEFVLVCEDLHNPDEASLLAQRVKDALAPPVVLADVEIRVSASIGVATTGETARPDDLLQAADAAMYAAKRGGKARYELADPELHVRAARRVTLERELHQALAENELLLHYQPIYDLATGFVTGVEALLRWQHPHRGLLLPADFLDVAEQRGLVGPVGEWVIRAATAQAARWQQTLKDRAPEMWVNICAGQLGHQQLSAHLRDALAASGADPAGLGVELTERELITSAHSVQADLDALPGLGVKLAIDDFGTGYAGFGYLRRFAVHSLKIDQSFISGLGQDATDTAITTSLISLARSLGITTVAEGVETPQQRDTLQQLGCAQAQGYLLHRPAPAHHAEHALAAGNRRLASRPHPAATRPGFSFGTHERTFRPE